MAERKCPVCNQVQPPSLEGDKCLYCGADLPPVEEAPAAPPAPEAAAPAPSEPPAAEQSVPEGKRKCPSCGEILYDTETRCWRCGHEMPSAVAAAAVTPPAEVTLPPVTSATPAAVAPTAAPPPLVITLTASAPAPDPAAQNLGIWALVVGLLSCFCCPIIGSIIAIYLGVQAKKRGVTGLGMAGIVLGIISLLAYTAAVIPVIVGIIAAQSATHTPTVTPEATSWLWSLRWMLS